MDTQEATMHRLVRETLGADQVGIAAVRIPAGHEEVTRERIVPHYRRFGHTATVTYRVIYTASPTLRRHEVPTLIVTSPAQCPK